MVTPPLVRVTVVELADISSIGLLKVRTTFAESLMPTALFGGVTKRTVGAAMSAAMVL